MESAVAVPELSPSSKYSWRFWVRPHYTPTSMAFPIVTTSNICQTIIISLSIASLLSALDISAISTAMPSMVKDLGSSYAYIWIANAYFLTMTAFQPLYGQTANIFGRRSLTLLAVFLFALGSAIAGPAPNMGVLIAGRAIKGIGGGGINILIEIIVADLVPLRDRPKFISIIFTAFTVAMLLGPVVGGLLAERVTWRWVFYLNLPIAGTAFLLLLFTLRVRYKKDTTWNSLKRVDFFGNFFIIASVVSVLLALTWGGVELPWTSWRTLVPLILGLVGLGVSIVIQSTGLIPEPTMPIRIFSNRTSLGGFGLTFFHSILLYWITYFLPVYFQAVLETGPTASGVNFLPSVAVTMPFAMLAGFGVSKFGRYRPWFFLGMALLAVGFGLFSRLDENSSPAYWAGVQCVAAAGVGTLTTTTLPAIQAPLAESDQAVATATWGFVRSFGGIWGAAIPAAIFNSRFNQIVTRLEDEDLRALLSNGGAYAMASSDLMASLSSNPSLKAEVKSMYVESLRLCWQVGIGFALFGFLIAIVTKEIPLREDLETEFGMEGVDQGTHVKAENST